MPDSAPKKWIAGAVKNPGALHRTAERKGLVKKGESMSMEDISTLLNSSNPTTRKRASLARTLMMMHR